LDNFSVSDVKVLIVWSLIIMSLDWQIKAKTVVRDTLIANC